MTRAYRPRGFKYPDPIEHAQHIAWLRAKAQEKYLGREWNLSLEDYMEIWGRELWQKRGRGSDDLSLARIDWDKPWTKDNVQIITRYQQVQISNHKHYEIRHGKSL